MNQQGLLIINNSEIIEQEEIIEQLRLTKSTRRLISY